MFFMSMSDTVLNRIQHMQKVAEVWQPQQNSLTPCSVKSQFNIPEIRHIFFSTTKLRYHNAFHHKVLYKAPEDGLCQNTPDPRELLQANSLLFLARSSVSVTWQLKSAHLPESTSVVNLTLSGNFFDFTDIM